MNSWSECKNILIIRADNMGDVLMSSPAIYALRQTFNARLTLLTSSRGYEAGLLNPDLDEVVSCDLPWVKTDDEPDPGQVSNLISLLSGYHFDGCIIFTVYSQNPLPSAMIAYMADIPLRLAYCRENPYGLLTDWVPDPEPYELIKHQVQRDLDLVLAIGATAVEKNMRISVDAEASGTALAKLKSVGLDAGQPYLLLHTSVSESKRHYPISAWASSAKKLAEELELPILLTGLAEDAGKLSLLEAAIGCRAISVAGLFSLAEFAAVIERAAVVISVNTGTIHLAAASQTPVVVLYAQTNPQHTPWMVPNVVLEYSIQQEQKSRNKIIEFVDSVLYSENTPLPGEAEVLAAVTQLLLPKAH
jgi:ADP-heptose:LPS heptosyltransferase